MFLPKAIYLSENDAPTQIILDPSFSSCPTSHTSTHHVITSKICAQRSSFLYLTAITRVPSIIVSHQTFTIASLLLFPLPPAVSFIHSSHYGLNNLFKMNITSCHSSNKYSMWSCMICFLPLFTSSWATFFLSLHAPATPTATQFFSIACCCSLEPSHILFPWPEMSSFPHYPFSSPSTSILSKDLSVLMEILFYTHCPI